MILSFINTRKVPREVLKTEGEARGFQPSQGTLRMLMNGKSCLIPLLLDEGMHDYHSNESSR